MTEETQPVLSVIVRRYPLEAEEDVRALAAEIQAAVSARPGLAGVQNSLSRAGGYCELVSVFSFATRRQLAEWDASPARIALVARLDSGALDTPTRQEFGNLSLLLPPAARIRRGETIAILIFWILLLGHLLRWLAGLLPVRVPDPWQNVLLVTLNVLLISYIFLPGSSIALTRLKARLARRKG